MGIGFSHGMPKNAEEKLFYIFSTYRDCVYHRLDNLQRISNNYILQVLNDIRGLYVHISKYYILDEYELKDLQLSRAESHLNRIELDIFKYQKFKFDSIISGHFDSLNRKQKQYFTRLKKEWQLARSKEINPNYSSDEFKQDFLEVLKKYEELIKSLNLVYTDYFVETVNFPKYFDSKRTYSDIINNFLYVVMQKVCYIQDELGLYPVEIFKHVWLLFCEVSSLYLNNRNKVADDIMSNPHLIYADYLLDMHIVICNIYILKILRDNVLKYVEQYNDILFLTINNISIVNKIEEAKKKYDLSFQSFEKKGDLRYTILLFEGALSDYKIIISEIEDAIDRQE